MYLRMILAAGAALLVTAAPASDTESPRERMLKRMAGEFDTGAPPPKAPSRTFDYGQGANQAIDFWRADPDKAAPLILFVHGGGWQHGSKDSVARTWKTAHYLEEGYNFAAINYRLVPDARVEDQAADIAAALKALLDRAGELGIRSDRVVLMGHSAGAHLVALVGTDPRYLSDVGLSLANVRGVIAIDGAAYDVPRQMKEGPPMMQATYQTAFGSDPTRQQSLSPTRQATAPNVARFLIPHVQRPDGIVQSDAFAAALKQAGTDAVTLSVPGTGLRGHAEINRRMGDPSYDPTTAVDRWLKEVFTQ